MIPRMRFGCCFDAGTPSFAGDCFEFESGCCCGSGASGNASTAAMLLIAPFSVGAASCAPAYDVVASAKTERNMNLKGIIKELQLMQSRISRLLDTDLKCSRSSACIRCLRASYLLPTQQLKEEDRIPFVPSLVRRKTTHLAAVSTSLLKPCRY